MKFTSEIEINAPIERVVDLFIDPSQLKKWIKELESFETLSGKARHIGSKSLLKFWVDDKGMEVIETIMVRNLPYQLIGKYESDDLAYTAENKFEDLGDNRTKYTVYMEFKFRGVMNLFGDAMKKAFLKKSEEQLNDFKIFIESEI